MADDLYAKGMAIRRKVLGDAYVDKALEGVNDFNRDFQQMLTEYCWGNLWGREAAWLANEIGAKLAKQRVRR